MRQRDKAGGKAAKTQRPKTLKRRNAPKVGHKPSAADANEKIALLEQRVNEALEQQTATSEVLNVRFWRWSQPVDATLYRRGKRSNSGHWPELAQNRSVAIDPKRTSAATTTQNLIMSVVVSVVLSAITGALTKSHVMYCSM